jgi:hypothetical protein
LPVPVCSNGSCIDEPLLFITVEEQVPFSSWYSYWLINIWYCQFSMNCTSGGDDGLQNTSVIQIYKLTTELSQLQGEKCYILKYTWRFASNRETYLPLLHLLLGWNSTLKHTSISFSVVWEEGKKEKIQRKMKRRKARKEKK